jgi:murein L,D-transpeptidase YcbB/YkuD
VLKAALAATPRANTARRDAIRINMDRWRWLPRDLGSIYLITNVPEFELRLAVNGKPIRTYRTIVGKPGRTATPQLAEKVEAVVFNPTWTVPQSIVVGEGWAPSCWPARARATR